tara:strand:+ start:5423 stop:5632 length:210 start_codon:yes stop_codon:yes gene_type:complete
MLLTKLLIQINDVAKIIDYYVVSLSTGIVIRIKQHNWKEIQNKKLYKGRFSLICAMRAKKNKMIDNSES